MMWWIILYYPAIFLIIWIGKQVEKKYPTGSVERNRSEMALGCALLSLPGMPAIIGVGYVIKLIFISIFGK
jgi:hypothetical protein